MFAHLADIISRFVIAVISAGGYPGIVLLMAIESACIPLPSEVIMPFSGYLVLTGRFNLWGTALAGAIGCNVGSIVAYWVGWRGGRPFIERYGKYLLISRRELAWADRWFERYGEATVFFSRLLPVIRTFIAFPAGVARMNFLRFNVYTFFGSFPWCLGLAYLGLKMGENWPRLRHHFERADIVIAAAILLGVIFFIYRHFRRHS
ncbi:MAG TPA: DedA family protein [Candidatus Acidoferrales bacterium]